MSKVSIRFFDHQLVCATTQLMGFAVYAKKTFPKNFYLTPFFAISIFRYSEPRKPLNNAQMSGVFCFLGGR